MLSIALAIALLSPAVLILVLRSSGVTTLSWSARIAFWLIGMVCFGLIASQMSVAEALLAIGLGPLTQSTLWVSALTTIAILAAGGLVSMLQRLLKLPLGDREGFAEIAQTSLSFRVLLVLTAGFVEEFLYRGIGIGIGAEVFGSSLVAAGLSLVAFILAHFRWKTAHLLQVAAAGGILSTTYLMTGDLWACIIAHVLVNGIGFLLVPSLIARTENSRVAAKSSR